MHSLSHSISTRLGNEVQTKTLRAYWPCSYRGGGLYWDNSDKELFRGCSFVVNLLAIFQPGRTLYRLNESYWLRKVSLCFYIFMSGLSLLPEHIVTYVLTGIESDCAVLFDKSNPLEPSWPSGVMDLRRRSSRSGEHRSVPPPVRRELP